MFDLNRQIDGWKSAFARKQACSTDELLELESHLREEIAALVAVGRSEQEAFSLSVSRLGDPDKICSEFAKNETGLLCDSVALRGNSALVVLVGLAAVVLGLVVWTNRRDGLLGAHQGSISFAYSVPFLLALVGTYAIFRASIVKSADREFRDRFTVQCKFLLGIIALGCATGAILGGFWAKREWGRFWAWDPKETGAFSVVVCALVLCSLVTRLKLSSVRLGQASLIMSLVTFVAWFGPWVYADDVSRLALGLLVAAFMVQLAILSIAFFLPKRALEVLAK
jgi:hypothetical protein